MSTVDLPVVGAVEKKWVWIGAGTVGAVIVAWSYYNKRASDAAPVIEEGVDGSEILPGDSGWGNSPGRTGDSTVTNPNDVIDTVAEWTADVVQKLAITDWDTTFVYSTIGKWIAGEGLQNNEKLLIMAAIAASGQPPGGPYPIKTAPPPTTTPPPTTNPPPPPAQNLPPVGTTVSVPGPTLSIYDWVSQLNRDYPGLNLDFVKLVDVLNPGSRKYIQWLNTSPNKTPVYNPQWSGRTPPLGIPPMRIR